MDPRFVLWFLTLLLLLNLFGYRFLVLLQRGIPAFQYQDKVFRLACGMLGNETVAQDIAQDVFLKVWKALPQFRGDASPSSWIYTIARNTCLSEIKKGRYRKHLSLAEETVELEVEKTSALGSPDAAPGSGMDIQTLLAEIPENYRRVLTLFKRASFGRASP